jgi:D-serine deaminase-like pyridoxal phosphate-dependent protein
MERRLTELETPCLIADRHRLTANAGRMRERARRFGVGLRPHLKTTKSAAIARIAHDAASGPITVSTLKEAEYFFRHGFDDITYAVCLSPNKFAHAIDLVDRGAKLKVLLASEHIARQLVDATAGRSRPISVLIEIDCGDHRTGLEPHSAELPAVGRCLARARGVTLAGLLTHGGQSYGCTRREQIVAVAEAERTCLLRAREHLASHGVEVPLLSSGSTPTAVCGENYDGLDELRPGVYLAGDLFQAQLGACAMEDIAISVLASVIAHDPARNRLVIDAGGLALSKDRSTQHSPVDYRYGLLVRADGSAFETDLIVADVSQEHGKVTSSAPLPFAELPVGAMVRVLPNHACMTAASYDRYYVTEGTGLALVDEWDKASGW